VECPHCGKKVTERENLEVHVKLFVLLITHLMLNQRSKGRSRNRNKRINKMMELFTFNRNESLNLLLG
jgi:hypothetical protein